MDGHRRSLLLRFASLAVLAAYGFQAWWHANRQESILDEGAYLLKGLLFVSGRHAPFEPTAP